MAKKKGLSRTKSQRKTLKKKRMPTAKQHEDLEREPVCLDNVDLVPLLTASENLLSTYREAQKHHPLSSNGFPSPPDVSDIYSARRELKRVLEPLTQKQKHWGGCLVSSKRRWLPEILNVMQEIVEKPLRTEAPSRLRVAVGELQEMLGVSVNGIELESAKRDSVWPPENGCHFQPGEADSRNEDKSAYVPVSELLNDRLEIDSYSKMNRFLQKTERVIRTRKPKKNRRKIHLGDWHRFWKNYDEMQFEALNKNSMQQLIEGIEKRTAEVRKKRESSNS